ncbi:MAG TPA: tetratricopeptide repeat protein [Ktedonobacteraceae bacterium]|nr:tetratricopeptide repeat protein [Ktedonobacteraceae bacterium]
MRSKLCAGGIASLLVVVTLFFVFPGSHVLAANSGVVSSVSAIPIDTPTPDTTAAVNAANNAVSQAQNLLTVMSVFATILGVVLALLSLFAAVLAFLGIRSYREVLSLASELRTSMAGIRSEADNTRSALVYLSLGDRLLNQKDTQEALKNYKEAGRLLPRDIQVQSMLGRVYSGAGDYETAISTLDTTAKLLEAVHPVDTVNLGNVEKELGLAYRRRGMANKQEADYDTAIQHLKKATALNPADSDALAILGGLYRRKGEYAQAYDSYKRAWIVNPASSYALGNVASLAWYEGKKDEARMYFGIAEMEAADHIKKGQGEIYWDYYDLALAQLALGKDVEARKNYATAIKETPGKVQFESVLDNLNLLQKAPQPMPGLDDIVKMIKAAANVR